MNTQLDPYKYKGIVEIPALGWIDDVITVSESGYKTARLNSFINAKFALKKLRLGAKKCYMMHVGNNNLRLQKCSVMCRWMECRDCEKL